MSSFLNRLRAWWRRLRHPGAAETQMQADLDSYRQLLIDRFMERGLDREDARRRAWIEMDGVEPEGQDSRCELGQRTRFLSSRSQLDHPIIPPESSLDNHLAVDPGYHNRLNLCRLQSNEHGPLPGTGQHSGP